VNKKDKKLNQIRVKRRQGYANTQSQRVSPGSASSFGQRRGQFDMTINVGGG